MGDDVAVAVDGVAIQLDSFSIEALGRERRVANDRVVSDVPVAAAPLQVDRIVVVQE